MPRAALAPIDYQEEILRSLRRIIRAVDLYSRRLVTLHGLSGPQLLCLRRLATSGAMPAGRLASEMSLSPATVCGILDRLEARGHVIRERQTDDKRRVLVRLTPKGRSTAHKAPPPLEHGFIEQLEALPIAKQAEIDRVLKRLVTMMSAQELDAAPVLASGASIAAAGKGSRAARTR